MHQFACLFKETNPQGEELHAAAYRIFDRIKLFALFTKHTGFSEENEWRFVYLKERDNTETLNSRLHYAIGKNGIEPKLKFKFEPTPSLTSDDFSLDKLLHKILLGPSLSTPLAILSFQRMLELCNRGNFSGKVSASGIPYRKK